MTTDTDTPTKSENQLISGQNIQSGQSNRSGAKTVKVNILGKEIQIGCAAGDEKDLELAAKYVDASMRESRERNKTLPVEKIAIVTAINLANDLIKNELNKTGTLSGGDRGVGGSSSVDGTTDDTNPNSLKQKLNALHQKVDAILEST